MSFSHSTLFLIQRLNFLINKMLNFTKPHSFLGNILGLFMSALVFLNYVNMLTNPIMSDMKLKAQREMKEE